MTHNYLAAFIRQAEIPTDRRLCGVCSRLPAEG
jgi:hypothetical protein